MKVGGYGEEVVEIRTKLTLFSLSRPSAGGSC